MSLDDLRKKIDDVDAKLVELLNQRIEFALDIGKLKDKSNGEVYVPAREKEVLERVASLSKGPLGDVAVKAIYREIMSAALALERNVKIAYFGGPATFTHQAARARFGGSVDYVSCETISDVFIAVEKKTTDYGVVPIENSTEGAVTHTLDQFTDTSLRICAEIYLPVVHNLMASVPKDAIRSVLSHPQVFGQCRHWLHKNMPGAELLPVSSTAKAAEIAAKSTDQAALASDLAAELYGLTILEKDIQDIGGNTTRFLVISKGYGDATGNDKTSVFFAVKHTVGALYDALHSFKDYGLNMTKIESRPSKAKAWEYFFFVDFEGHASEDHVQKALDALSEHCTHMTVLGSYPKAQGME